MSISFRRGLALIGALAGVALSLALTGVPIGGVAPGDWRPAGYFGILLLALIASCVPGFPVPIPPVLFLAGQTLNPAVVAVCATAGMVAGDLVVFGAGAGGRGVVETAPRWPRLTQAAAWARAHYARFGLVGIAVLALIPNPLYKLAAATAGASRVSVARFLLAAAAGKLVKALILAYAGYFAFGSV
jgi:membrane protein DedA with SNARE-associated domain